MSATRIRLLFIVFSPPATRGDLLFCACLCATQSPDTLIGEHLPKVILERKLDFVVIDIEAVTKVNSSAKLELAADHYLVDGRKEKIRTRIVSLMEIRRKLSV